jgi:hypothetical protein
LDERRRSRRDKVVFGCVAAIDPRGTTRDCVVRNISDHGAALQFGSAIGLPDEMTLTVPKKARSFASKIVWRRGDTLGVSFSAAADGSDLGARLRRSERNKRELQNRIRVLLGEA